MEIRKISRIEGGLGMEKPKITKYQSVNPSSIYPYYGCDMRMEKHKEDCYFYREERDMSAIIHTCSYYGKMGYCPCDECNKYFKKCEVYGIVKKIVDEEASGMKAKKPKKKEMSLCYSYYCAKCGHRFISKYDSEFYFGEIEKFCSNCGTPVDWSGEITEAEE